MTNVFLLSLLVGAVLGIRPKVMILIPVTGIAFAAIAGFGAARGDTPSSIATAMVLAGITLQLGYLAGSATRFVLAVSRISRRSISRRQRGLASSRPTIGT